MDKQLNYIEKRRSVRIRRSKLLKNTENIEYKIAISTEELEQAFELVTKQYISAGLHNENDDLRLTKFHFLPSSKVFVAIQKQADYSEKVVGTLTMVEDSSMGLPMDEIYPERLQRLRISNLKLAEVIGLAVSPEQSAIHNNIVMYLYKICLQFSRFTQITDLLCTVKPKHTTFYESLLLFKRIGDLVPYSYAKNMLVQGYRLNLYQANKEFEEIYSGMEFDADLHRFFFTDTKQFNRPYGKGDAMTPEQQRYFLEKRTQLLSSLSHRDKSILRDEYAEKQKIFSY